MTLPTPHHNDDDFEVKNTTNGNTNDNHCDNGNTTIDSCTNNDNRNNCSLDEDIFGPPRSTSRPRVPMISAKLRLREERKRILQLCAHKLEKIKDSETNLRRSVCINNTYARLASEIRREKQSRYLANLPKCDTKIDPDLDSSERICGSCRTSSRLTVPNQPNLNCFEANNNRCNNSSHHQFKENYRPSTPINPNPKTRKRSHVEDTDLETLDREISALDAAMPPIDPEITQGAEQLEKALVSRKRTRMEEEHDRLVKEALSQFYLPSPRLISGIDDCPTPPSPLNLDIKRPRLMTSPSALELDLSLDTLNQNHQREFEVIMETLRLGGTNVVSSSGNTMAGNVGSPQSPDSCGQAAMMSEQGVFHNLVIASLET